MFSYLMGIFLNCHYLFSVIGVTVVSRADKHVQYEFPPGAVWSILGAFFYAAYIVLLRRKIDNEELIDFPMFFGKFL